MPDENLHIFNDPNIHVNRAQWYAQLFEAYAWHFRIKERPATFDELVKFAQWQGFKEKNPTKSQLVNFFLDNKICF